VSERFFFHLKRERTVLFSNVAYGDLLMERDNLMHGARTALNTNQDTRAWAEQYLKEKTRGENTQMTDEEFEKYWRYHKPEIMHAGAAEAMSAYREDRRRETGD
jgi:hypothetical protein